MASPSQKEPAKQSATTKSVDLAIRSPLPGNRPIVPTNKDAAMDDFVGYMD